MKTAVWVQILQEINLIDKILPYTRERTGGIIHREVKQLLKKYKNRSLLTSKDLEILLKLRTSLEKNAKTSAVISRSKRSDVYNDIDTLLSNLQNIAESSSRKRGGDQSTVIADVFNFSYEDENDLILDALGYTDVEGNKSKDLFFYKKDEHVRSLFEEDIVMKTLTALRKALGEKNFYEFMNAKAPSGKYVFDEISDRYVEFNLVSDQPQGDFYALVSSVLEQLKRTSQNMGLFDKAKETFIKANTYLSIHERVVDNVNTFGIYIPERAFVEDIPQEIDDEDFGSMLYDDIDFAGDL